MTHKQWNTPSKSFAETIISALEGIKLYNYQMIVKYLPNSEHENPLNVPNGNLDNPFNWHCTSQFHRSPEQIKEALSRCLNETEKDLMLNWTWIFGEPEAIKLYEETGKCTPGLFKGMGTCSQVRIKDLISYLKETGETERAELWENPHYFNSGIWAPKGISYWQPAEGMSYAVYYCKNEEGLTTDQLNELLDNSVKQIIKQ